MNELIVAAPGDAGLAEKIASDERYWMQDRWRVVCWLAVRLQWAQGAKPKELCKIFGIGTTTLGRYVSKQGWRPSDLDWLAPLAPVLRKAIGLRRRLKGVKAKGREDERACAIRQADDESASDPLQHWQRVAPSSHARCTDTPGATAQRDEASEHIVEANFEPVLPWTDIAHAAQLAPGGAWRTWLLMGGRGAGKTRAGAEWVRGLVEGGVAKRVALIGPSLHDVREVMIAGPSGLCAICDEAMRPKYEVTRRRLVWPPVGLCAGAVAFAFSAEDPESLRGPQFDAAWCDEIGAWAKDLDTWKTLAFGMRLGAAPRIVATTTPRPRALVKLLVGKAEAGRGAVVMTQAATRANARNLSPEFVEALEEDYGGTPLGRQELDGELIEDLEGALWTRAMIEAARCSVEEAEGLERVVVAVDPPAGAGGRSNACGIVVAGVKAGVVYVLADATVRGLRPAEWAKRVAAAAEAYGAGLVVAESNQGGEMVRDVLEAAGEGRVRVKLEHASKGKRDRAEPVSAKYDQGRVRHVRVLKELEDEMCSFGAPGAEGPRSRSPDRVDALVWAVTVLTRKAPPKAGVEVL